MIRGCHTLKDVVGIGNAIVDVLASADDAFLAAHELTKGGMTLVGPEQAVGIQEAMGSVVEVSGGSVGNTIAGVASLGGTGSFIGKVRDDKLGEVFTKGLESLGISFSTVPALQGSPTGRCLVIVTPDGQRSMATYLGACVELGPEDINSDTISRHQVTYLEGYLWDAPRAKEAMLKAARLAHECGRQVALTLSDALCVDRHRDSFRDLILNHVDVLFANEHEITSLYQADNVFEAITQGSSDCELVVVTRNAEGSLVISGENIHRVEAVPVERVIDTTGAGDLYAAGFLFGLTHGYQVLECGRIGSIAAGEIIRHFGARPEEELQMLLDRNIEAGVSRHTSLWTV